MNRQAHLTAESFAAGSFAISVMLTALRTSTSRAGLHTERGLLDSGAGAFGTFMTKPLDGTQAELSAANLLGIVAQPSNPVLWALLAAVVIAIGLHMVTRFGRAGDYGLRWPQTLGLMLAAIWPWLLNPLPPAGLALAALSCLLLVLGMMPRPPSAQPVPLTGPTAPRIRCGLGNLSIAFITGWLLMSATSAFGMYVYHELGLGIERSVLIGLLAAALLGAWAQLQMEGSVTFSLAVIWAMIGFAAATAGTSITIATACVLGIAALAVVLVRVTT